MSSDTSVNHARTDVRPDKLQAVADLAESFRTASASILTEYRGLTVKQMSELRHALGAGTDYSVVKNTLTKIAAARAGVEGIDVLLSGPTAVAFVTGEPVHAARALRDFSKAHPSLVVKGGVVDGHALSADEVRRLADLETREVLLSRWAGAASAAVAQGAVIAAAPAARVAALLDALADRAEAEAAAAARVSEAPPAGPSPGPPPTPKPEPEPEPEPDVPPDAVPDNVPDTPPGTVPGEIPDLPIRKEKIVLESEALGLPQAVPADIPAASSLPREERIFLALRELDASELRQIAVQFRRSFVR